MAAELSELQLELNTTIAPTLEWVENKTQLEEWMPPFVESFNVQAASAGVDFDFFAAISFLPESLWRHYLARLNGKVISVASLFLGAGVAGLYNIATPVCARGQGYGTWITQAVLREAAQMGYQIATLQSTNPTALRLYQRLGFGIYNKTSIYQRQAGQ
jgi:ribosomal protein S18 acetylase RimI-like enzyme